MFDIHKSHCYTIEQKLIWNIMELLKQEAPLILQEEIKEELPELCQLCGKDHSNVGVRMACAKKNKQKG